MRGSISHSTVVQSEVQDILRVLALLAVFITLTSAIVLALSVWLRIGLSQPTELFALILFQLAATVTAPHLFVRLGMVRSASLLGLAPISVLFIPLLGFFLPYWILVSTLAIFAVAGFGLAIRSLRFSVVGVISTLVCAVTFAVWIVLHYNADLDMPILAPELALTGTLKRDGYFHAALTHLIMHNGFPSTGVDGLKPLLLYHTAVHYWVAALAKVSGAAPLLAFPVVAQDLMVPLALFALGFAVAVSAQLSGRLKLIAVIIALSGYVGFEQFVQNSFQTTSMLFAMVFFFLAFPTLYPILTTHSSRRETWVAAGLTVLFLPVKVSLAVMWIMSLVYASVRRSALPPRSQLGLLALFGVVFIALCLLVRTATFLEWDNPAFHFFTHYDMGRYLFPLAVPFLLVAVSLIENRVTSWDKLTTLVLEGRLLVAEIAVVLSAAALVIAVIGVFPRSIPYYFILTVGWFAWPPLVITLMREIAAVRPDSITTAKDTWLSALTVGPAQLAMIAVAVLGALTLLMGLTIAKPLLDPFYRQRTALSYELGLPTVSRKGFDWDAIRARHVFPPELGKTIGQGLGQRFAQDVHRLAAGSVSKVAVFAPPDNAAFWSLVRPCEAKSLFIPAVTGLPMLLGMPPKSMTECMPGMIWYSQRRQYGDAHTREMSRAELCAHARQRAIDAVIVLGKEQSELIDCSQ